MNEKMTEVLTTVSTELRRLHSLLADTIPDLKKVECQCKCNSPQPPKTEPNEPETQILNAKEADDDRGFTAITSIGEWNGGKATTMPALETILAHILKDSPTVRFTLDPNVILATHKTRELYNDFPKVREFLKARKPYEFIVHEKGSEKYQVAFLDDLESDKPDIDEVCPHLLFDTVKNLVCECDEDGIGLGAEVKVDPYYDLLSLSKLLENSDDYDFSADGIELLHNFLLSVSLYDSYGKKGAIRPGVFDNDEDD